PGDVRRGDVSRLEHGRPRRMEIPPRAQPQPAGKLRSQVADDVAKQIARDNHIELPRIANNLHRQRVNKKVPRVNVRVLLADFLEHTLPQAVRKSHGIRLVAHAHALQAVLPRILERIANNALDSFARVNVFLHGNLIGRALLERSANANIKAFRVFAKDDEANIFLGTVSQGRKPIVKQFHRTGVHVEVELESQAQQNV